jgi:predicted Fe-S protein YdhL (DUF1289 family)
MSVTATPLPSPCTGVCRLDGETSLCLGCGRAPSEIASWRSVSDERRQEIWNALPARFERLGITVVRLPWDLTQIRDFIVSKLKTREGTWVLGCHGATAEFLTAQDEDCSLDLSGEAISAATARGALRFKLPTNLRALQLRGTGSPAGTRAIFLVQPVVPPMGGASKALTFLGPDTAAVAPANRGESLFDLGLGREDMRFCVRSSSQELTGDLAASAGFPLADILRLHGGALFGHSPDRIVETAIGRIEVKTRIPTPVQPSPDGPHTHLLPGHLATGRATAPGIDIPAAYTLCATYYPRAVVDEQPAQPCASSE